MILGPQGAEKNPINLIELGADPSTVADVGFLYTKDVAGDTGLFFDNNTQSPVQLAGGAGISAPGSNTQVLYNDSGVVGADSGMTFNETTNALTLLGYLVSPSVGPVTTQQHILPAVASDTVALLAATQALTGKTYNGMTLTSTTGTLTLAAGKTLTASNTLTFTGTDGSSVAFGAGGAAAYTANKLSDFAATTSAELAGVISDETGGAGVLMFNASPTVTGVLTASSGAAITAGSYQFGRDADATNQLHFNVPTGAGMEWSINDVAKMSMASTGSVTFASAAIFADGAEATPGIRFSENSGFYAVPASGVVGLTIQNSLGNTEYVWQANADTNLVSYRSGYSVSMGAGILTVNGTTSTSCLRIGTGSANADPTEIAIFRRDSNALHAVTIQNGNGGAAAQTAIYFLHGNDGGGTFSSIQVASPAAATPSLFGIYGVATLVQGSGVNGVTVNAYHASGTIKLQANSVTRLETIANAYGLDVHASATKKYTISPTAPATSLTYGIKDFGASGDFLVHDGTTGTFGTVGSGTGVTVNNRAAHNRATVKYTVTYAALAAAALTADKTIHTLPAKARLVGIIADTTTPFTGGGVTAATLIVGKTVGGNEYIVSHDVFSGAVTKGLADADLGTSINRANATQGGDLPSWTATTGISVRLTTVTANTDQLTAGSVTFYLTIELLP